MRHYETLFIIDPNLNEEHTSAVVEKFSDILIEGGATITKVDLWGRRRLAYEIKKNNKGYYVLFDYGAIPATVNEVERKFKIDERVIRYLTIKKNDIFDSDAIARDEANAATLVACEVKEKITSYIEGGDGDETDNENIAKIIRKEGNKDIC